MILKIYINKNIDTIFFYLYKKEKLITNFDDFSLFFCYSFTQFIIYSVNKFSIYSS